MTTPIPACLCCGGELSPIIDFGPTRLANTYGVEQKFPLALNLCSDCFHLQLSQSVSPEILYRDYFYCSGTSRTSLAFFDWFAQMAVSRSPGARHVLDIACNDGTQLDSFQQLGLVTCGCDPARNLAVSAGSKGHSIHVGMFEDMPDRTGVFDLITAQNVLAHSPRPLDFLRNAARMMGNHSRLLVVTSQADMIAKGECDTVYHEHVSYFNTQSMQRLANRAGLQLLDIDTHAIHGTSYIFTIGLVGNASPKVASRIAIEDGRGLYAQDTYWYWALTAKRAIARFRKAIEWHRAQGYVAVGLGAAAKGISMLNMAGVRLDYLFDTTPIKHGRMASGMLIQPFEEIASLTDERVLFVTLAWNFEAEVRENVAKYRNNPNDVFITDR